MNYNKNIFQTILDKNTTRVLLIELMLDVQAL